MVEKRKRGPVIMIQLEGKKYRRREEAQSEEKTRLRTTERNKGVDVGDGGSLSVRQHFTSQKKTELF